MNGGSFKPCAAPPLLPVSAAEDGRAPTVQRRVPVLGHRNALRLENDWFRPRHSHVQFWTFQRPRTAALRTDDSRLRIYNQPAAGRLTRMLPAFLTTILFAISAVSANRSTRLLGGVAANFWRISLATLLLGLWAHTLGSGVA